MFKVILLISLFLTACSNAPFVAVPRLDVQEAGRQEAYFTGTDKTKLFYQSWVPVASSSKAVVIIVHGLKDHSDRYEEAAQKLMQNNYAVYAFDNRGHANSEGQRVWVESFQQYVDDLEIFYDIVSKSQPKKPIYLFGHSMGGAIVTLFALQHKRNIAGLILSAPALKATDDISGFLKFSTKMLGTIAPTMAVFELKDENFSRDPAVVKALKNDPLVYHKKAPARTAKELLKAMDSIQDEMAQLQTPFLCLHGKKDLLTNPQGSQDLYQKAASKDKAIRFYPNSYHDLLHEPEKELVLNAILGWLDWHTKAK